MKATLITKNKLVEYMQLYPEATSNILLWAKEFGRRLDKHIDAGFFQNTSEINAQLGASKYRVQYTVNNWLRVAYIKWLGTEAEMIERHNNLLKESEAKGTSSAEVKVVSCEIVLSPPPPSDLQEQLPPHFPELSDAGEVLDSFGTTNPFYSCSEYEAALQRAIDLFSSKPGSPEFAELQLLLPSIIKYESEEIILPAPDLAELAKTRMKEIGVSTQQIAHVLGGEDAMNAFLYGKEMPALEKLRKLFYYDLGIRYADVSELVD